MTPAALSELLKLSPGERAELAIALWESLTDTEREAEAALTPEQREELDRRWTEHLKDPGLAIPWEQVRRILRSGQLAARFIFDRKRAPS